MISMRKGFAIPVVGTMILIVSYIIIVLIVNITGGMTMSALLHGDVAVSSVHEVEWLRKISLASVEFVGEDAAKKLLAANDYWSETGPTFDQMRARLDEAIESGLPTGTYKGSYRERGLDFGLPLITTKDYDKAPCGSSSGGLITSKCFRITGNQTFSLTDSRVSGTIGAPIKYDTIANSSYFELVSVGRKVLENERWKIAKSLTTTANGKFNITAVKCTDVKCELCKEITPTEQDSNYYYVDISGMPERAILCGFGEKPGLLSLDDYSNAKTIATDIASAMATYLQDLYRNVYGIPGLRFKIDASQTVGTQNRFSAEFAFMITDDNSKAYSKDPLVLKFRTLTTFSK